MGAASMTTGQFREFAGAVLRSIPDDLDPITVQGWIENQESLRKVLREALVLNGSKTAGDTYPVTVNYDLSVEDAVKAGKYVWANSDISSKNFPSKRKGTAETEIILVHFNRLIASDEAIYELDCMGLRPAELPEGLAFGAKFPDVQREFPIIILGSVWKRPFGFRSCACLDGFVSKRRLVLGRVGTWWGELCRFAAVRK